MQESYSYFFLTLLTGLSSLAASYLNPVKSFVPQMPKLLKSLFPVREDKKARQPSPLAQQVKKKNIYTEILVSIAVMTCWQKEKAVLYVVAGETRLLVDCSKSL